MKKRSVFRGGLALLLSVALAVGLMPEVGKPPSVNAADGDKTIAGLGVEAIADPSSPDSEDSAWTGSYVYFGRYDGNPVKYRVLSKNAIDFNGSMLLDCDSILWQGSNPSSQFDDDSNLWANSKIKTYLNSTFLFNSFSVIEQNAIAESIKPHPGSMDGNGLQNQSWFHYAPLWGEKIFLLDAKEATSTFYGYYKIASPSESRKKKAKAGEKDFWWLRSDDSEMEGIGDVACIDSSGFITGATINELFIGVSPALNLNRSSILFASVISGTAGQVGAEYKLTVLDSGMHIATNGDITQNGDTVTIPYTISGSSANNATQVSILILDKEYIAGNSNNAKVLAYEKLNVDSFSTSGTGIFTFPAELSGKACGTDYYAYLVAEDVNGQKETDYASKPVAIDIQETKKVSSVQVMLDNPAAGQAFDSTAECTTEGIESVSTVWTGAIGQPISGHADYNKIYTLKLIITPAEGYVFDTTTSIQLNDGSKTVENIILNPDDGTLSGIATFQTAKARLLSISKPAPITGIANGTEKTSEALGLPDIVTIETEDAAMTTAAVEWKMDEITQERYDPSILDREQTFTVYGTVVLPEQIENSEGISLETSINVTVLMAGFTGNPVASPVEGTYAENQSVALRSSTQDAEIYYTTGDVTPDQANGTRYTEAIPVTGTPGESVTTTIRAVAVKDGMQGSEVAVFTYIINLPALKYAVTVRNGTGSGEYEQGQTVTIAADDPAKGKQFKNWNVEKGTVILTDSNAATTTFTMPAEAVSITAVYVDKQGVPDTPDDPDDSDNLDTLDDPNTEAYYILDGANSSWMKGSERSLVITGSGDFSKFTGVKVDESLLDKGCYEAVAGSTVIALKAAYLNTLTVGKHAFEILWTDGSAKTSFTICEAEKTEGKPREEHKSPKTGDAIKPKDIT